MFRKFRRKDEAKFFGNSVVLKTLEKPKVRLSQSYVWQLDAEDVNFICCLSGFLFEDVLPAMKILQLLC